MQEPPLDRRTLLAMLPAALAAPAALGQVASPPGAGTPTAPTVRARPGVNRGGSDGITMPFAIAACWADDFGALDAVRMRAKLDCTIGFRSVRAPTSDDDSCAILLSMGAAIECACMLASASMAGTGLLYAPPKESGDLLVFTVRLGEVRRPPTTMAVQSALGIFARPDPRGAFDPAATVPPECLEKIRVSMIEQNLTAVVIQPSAKAAFLDALFGLAKGSTALAAAIGSRESWEGGCTPVLMGRGPGSSLQLAITAGRGVQRAGLYAHQYGVSVDARLLLPSLLEAAAAGSSERVAASNALARMLPGEGFEPLAVMRVGRLLSPKPRAAGPAMQMLEPSLEAPAAAPPVAPPAALEG